jgi:hypothetical protein
LKYEEWEATVPETITADSLWKMQAYRFALFLADIGWHDVTKLMQDRRTIGLADQLYRSLGSIGSNLMQPLILNRWPTCFVMCLYLNSSRGNRLFTFHVSRFTTE